MLVYTVLVYAVCIVCCVLRCCIPCEIRHYMPCCYMIRLYILCASSLYAVLLYILCSTQACHRVRKKIRQKLYTRAQFMPLPSQIPAETLQRCKIKLVYAPKSGRNFTAVRSLCRIRTHTKHNRIHNEPPHKPALPSSLLTKADLACIESTPCFQL